MSTDEVELADKVGMQDVDRCFPINTFAIASLIKDKYWTGVVRRHETGQQRVHISDVLWV